MWHKILCRCNVADVKKLERLFQGMTISNSSKFESEIFIGKTSKCQE